MAKLETIINYNSIDNVWIAFTTKLFELKIIKNIKVLFSETSPIIRYIFKVYYITQIKLFAQIFIPYLAHIFFEATQVLIGRVMRYTMLMLN